MASPSATAAPVLDPARLTESLAEHRAAKLRKSGAKWRQLISGLFDDDPVKRAAAIKSFPRDRDKLVGEMGLTEKEAAADLSAMHEYVQMQTRCEAFDHDRRPHLEKRASELPGELEKAVECLRTTNEMLQRLGFERQNVRMDLHAAAENRERLRCMVLANPRLFDQPPAPSEPAAAKPAADDSVTVKPKPTDDRNKTVTLHEVPIEGQGRKGEGPAAPKTEPPPTGGGRPPIILDELSEDAHSSPMGDRQPDHDPLAQFRSGE